MELKNFKRWDFIQKIQADQRFGEIDVKIDECYFHFGLKSSRRALDHRISQKIHLPSSNRGVMSYTIRRYGGDWR